jgi:hypothetical protein
MPGLMTGRYYLNVMIELTFKDHREEAELAGLTVAEAREACRREGGIPAEAVATLNGRRIDRAAEAGTILNDDDCLGFSVSGKKRLAYLAGALLLALGLTAGVFAYGFMNASTTLSATVAESNFADVTANTTALPSWNAGGLQRGSTGNGTLFDVDTTASGYTGDLVATLTLANVDELTHIYRVLSLSIEVRDSAGNIMDINGDGSADSRDYTLLTLRNGTVNLNITQGAADEYHILLRNGHYRCNVKGSAWDTAHGIPSLYCEIAQR